VTRGAPAHSSRSGLDIRAVPFSDDHVQRLSADAQAYYVGLYGGPDSAPVDPADFSPPDGAFFIGYDDAGAKAIGGWRFYRGRLGIEAHRPAEIKRMWVDPAARRCGHGRALLAHIEASAAAAGADALVLETGSPQHDAIAMYREAGYTDVPRFGHYARVPGAVHLGKRLFPPA
jgi:ribosomal protein S18 acetylase RimI-like enzyme